MEGQTFGVGAIGLGGFANFAVKQFAGVDGVDIVAVSDINESAANQAASDFSAEAVSADALLQRDDVDMVYLGTPPFLHYDHAIRALRAGKHVLTEKPMALTVEQADEMVDEARRRNLVCATDLMQRYNPLYHKVSEVLERGLLGQPLRGYLENYAVDDTLGPNHWFWDRDKSGGIFIEHGVHFFDMFAGWLGDGEVVASQALTRPDGGMEDQVHCTVKYRDLILVDFYHGFTQPGRFEHQELRIHCERGDITLHEWVPTRAEIRAIVDDETKQALAELFEEGELSVLDTYEGDKRSTKGRGKDITVDQKIGIRYGQHIKKMERYAQIVGDLFRDQLAWIRDPGHERRITELNGRNSVATAVAADRMAHGNPSD